MLPFTPRAWPNQGKLCLELDLPRLPACSEPSSERNRNQLAHLFPNNSQLSPLFHILLFPQTLDNQRMLSV